MDSHSARRNPGESTEGHRVLDRFLDVLEAIVAGAPETSLESLAAVTALPKPTAHRILAGLARREYVVALGHGLYAPGAQLLILLGRTHRALGYPLVARPYLLQLQSLTQHTIHFGLLVGGEVVYVDKLEGDRQDRLTSMVGMRLALHSTAIGKVILAHLPDARRDSLLATRPLTSYTRHTVTDRDRLHSELTKIQLQGFALDNEENEDDVRCVSAPVFGHRGDVIGAISVSARAQLFSSAQAAKSSSTVIAAANRISEALGASPPKRSGSELELKLA
jgi:IclR family acetate operon transcriptional repressor